MTRPPDDNAPSAPDASPRWERLKNRFDALHEKQRRLPKKRWLWVIGDFEPQRLLGLSHTHRLKSGKWTLRAGPDAKFRDDFQEIATEAGIGLGPTEGIPPYAFWMRGLFLDLWKKKMLGGSLRQTRKGAAIRDVCNESAAFCSRLRTRALEAEAATIELGRLNRSAEPAEKKAAKPLASEKLPPKKQDLSQYFDQAHLTDAQREAISLKLEYEMSVSAISRRLKINRKSVDERIAAAERKIQTSGAAIGRAKKHAIHNPGNLIDH